MVGIELVEDIRDERLSCWNKLLEETENPLPFQRYEWAKCWWSSFSDGKKKLLILLARKNAELIGIAPLMRKKQVLPQYQRIEFIGSGYFDYFDFIIKRGEEKTTIEGFAGYLYKIFPNFELKLNNIFENSPAFKILKERILCGDSRGLLIPEDAVPFIDLPVAKEDFYAEIKNSLRQDIARQEKRLGGIGRLDFGECASLEEADKALEDFFILHIKKWESHRGYSVFRFNQRRIFLKDILHRLFAAGIANIYYLSLGEKNIAVCLAFRMGRRFVYYSPAYDPVFAKYSPFKLLLNILINYAIKNGHQEFDFGIGVEPYKMQWPVKTKRIFSIFIYTNICLKYRRLIISKYRLYILPNLRRMRFLVYFWRWLKRKRGQNQK